MSIRAVLQKGIIRPVEPLPPDWTEGQELLVDQPKSERTDDINQWAKELEDSTEQVPSEEHDRFLKALDEIEQESKESIRKQWGRS